MGLLNSLCPHPPTLTLGNNSLRIDSTKAVGELHQPAYRRLKVSVKVAYHASNRHGYAELGFSLTEQ